MTKASDNVFPRLLISEGGSTATPASGRVTVYAKANGLLYSKDDAGAETALGGGSGSVATDAIWTTAGKVAVATGTATATEQWPPGHEFDYVARTSNLSVTATTAGTADAVVTGNAVTYDGSTIILLEFYCAFIDAGVDLLMAFFDGSTQVDVFAAPPNSVRIQAGKIGSLRLTPTAAAHTYSVRAWKTSGTTNIYANTGTGGNIPPAYIRQTKV